MSNSDKKYTMPRNGNTERGDEFLHVTWGDRPVWMDVPEDSIGQPVEGWIIRRPVPVATGESALSDAMGIMKGLERQITELGLKFAIYREGVGEKTAIVVENRISMLYSEMHQFLQARNIQIDLGDLSELAVELDRGLKNVVE